MGCGLRSPSDTQCGNLHNPSLRMISMPVPQHEPTNHIFKRLFRFHGFLEHHTLPVGRPSSEEDVLDVVEVEIICRDAQRLVR